MSDFKSATVRHCDQQNRALTAAEIAIIKGEWIQWAESEIAALRQKLEQAEARCAELTEMFAQGFDADGDPDEWRARAMKSIAGGLPSANAS